MYTKSVEHYSLIILTMKFNKIALANSLAALTGTIYIVFYFAAIAGPFKFIFNAQFLGADITSLIPANFSFSDFIGALIVVVITAWITGYLWGWLYNRFAK